MGGAIYVLVPFLAVQFIMFSFQAAHKLHILLFINPRKFVFLMNESFQIIKGSIACQEQTNYTILCSKRKKKRTAKKNSVEWRKKTFKTD